jgi:enoyl-[acyl-carrier-protein] reductase (NADH)
LLSRAGANCCYGSAPFLRGAGLAQASLWLASDASSYITGTTIHADAGYTSR